MANRYWVGGTGNWNDTSHWSTTNGGAGGATLPTNTDDVFIFSGTSEQTISTSSALFIKSLTVDTVNGTNHNGIIFNLSGAVNIYAVSPATGVTLLGKVKKTSGSGGNIISGNASTSLIAKVGIDISYLTTIPITSMSVFNLMFSFLGNNSNLTISSIAPYRIYANAIGDLSASGSVNMSGENCTARSITAGNTGQLNNSTFNIYESFSVNNVDMTNTAVFLRYNGNLGNGLRFPPSITFSSLTLTPLNDSISGTTPVSIARYGSTNGLSTLNIDNLTIDNFIDGKNIRFYCPVNNPVTFNISSEFDIQVAADLQLVEIEGASNGSSIMTFNYDNPTNFDYLSLMRTSINGASSGSYVAGCHSLDRGNNIGWTWCDTTSQGNWWYFL